MHRPGRWNEHLFDESTAALKKCDTVLQQQHIFRCTGWSRKERYFVEKVKKAWKMVLHWVSYGLPDNLASLLKI